jgi:hypothetical protein
LFDTDATQIRPSRTDCPDLLAWFRVGSPARQFWLPAGSGEAFTVRLDTGETVLATCTIAAGECFFSVP